MKSFQGFVDSNDLAYITEKFGEPLYGKGAPWSKGKFHPHVTRFLMKDGRKLSVFHIKPIYYEHADETWRPMSEIMEFHGNRQMVFKIGWETKVHPRFLRWLIKRQAILGGSIKIPSPNKYVPITDRLGQKDSALIHFATDTYYPDPDAETTTVDGIVGRVFEKLSGQNELWADLISGAGNEAYDNLNTITVLFRSDDIDAGEFEACRRSIMLFDTSSIDDSDTVGSATLSLYSEDKVDEDNALPENNIYGSTPASNTALVAADYNQVGSTAFSTAIGYSAWDANGFNDFVLNASGLSAVSKTSVSKFSWRESKYDAAAVAPGIGLARTSSFACSSAEVSGTSQDPRLVVSHWGVTTSSSSTSTSTSTSSSSSSTTTSPPTTSSTTTSSTTTTTSTTTSTSSSTSSTTTGPPTSTSSSSTTTHMPFLIPELEILPYKPFLSFDRLTKN